MGCLKIPYQREGAGEFPALKICGDIEEKKTGLKKRNDYYPFGLVIAGLSTQKENSLGNLWTFQGQERQDALDLGWYGYKWRNHQPELGRFFNVDPLSEDYKYNSTFAFSENKVTNSIELEGLESLDLNIFHSSRIDRLYSN
jgi:RHS repeat-associated protein